MRCSRSFNARSKTASLDASCCCNPAITDSNSALDKALESGVGRVTSGCFFMAGMIAKTGRLNDQNRVEKRYPSVS